MRYEINSVASQNQASHLASNFAGACLVVDSKEPWKMAMMDLVVFGVCAGDFRDKQAG
jgi:hypothetical protein